MIILIKIPDVYAAGKVEIESIVLIEKSEDTKINSEPTINELNTSFDLGFKNVNDYAKYKIVVNNSTDEDYEISDKAENTSEYLSYEYEFENNNKVVKKNSKLIVFLTIKAVLSGSGADAGKGIIHHELTDLKNFNNK